MINDSICVSDLFATAGVGGWRLQYTTQFSSACKIIHTLLDMDNLASK